MSSPRPIPGTEPLEGSSSEINMQQSLVASQIRDPRELTNMAASQWIQFTKGGVVEDLEKAFEYINEAMSLTPAEDSELPLRLMVLGGCLSSRFDRLGNRADLDECIRHRKRAVLLTPPGDSDMSSRLTILAGSFSVRFGRFGDVVDINEAIKCMSQALSLRTQDDSAWPNTLYVYGSCFVSRYMQLGELADLDEAIRYTSQAMSLSPQGHLNTPAELQILGCLYIRRFDRAGKPADLDEGIRYMDQAISAAPEGHPEIVLWLNLLGSYVGTRFEHFGGLEDLESSIKYNTLAVSLSSQGHPDLHVQLNNLGLSLLSRFESLGQPEDLHEAIEHLERAILLLPQTHPDMLKWICNLGQLLRTRYLKYGRISDLDEAILRMSQALSGSLRKDLGVAHLLNTLGLSLCDRFERLGDIEDLHKAVENSRQAVSLTSEGDSYMPIRLANLSHSLRHRFKKTDDVEDLDKSIGHLSKATDLIPTGHILLPALRSNLGLLFGDRFDRLHEESDLHKAVGHLTQAVLLTPQGHPDLPGYLNNVSTILSSRFKSLGKVEDLNEAIDYMSQAVSLSPHEHPRTLQLHKNLGHFYSERSELPNMTQDVLQAAKHFQIAAESTTGSLSIQLGAALEWARLCTKHSTDSVLVAYGQVMELLPQLVWLESGMIDRYKHTRYVGRFTTEAAAAAIKMKDYGLALEWLEEGRSIVWKQMLQLRSPFDELSAVHPALGEELKQVACDLDSAGFLRLPGGGASASATTSEETAQRHRRLAEKWNKLVEQVRNLPGFDAFLRPRRASELTAAAQSGPVVVVNVQKDSCDALVIQPGSADIAHIPLKFSYENATKARDRLTRLARSRSATDRGIQSGTDNPKDELERTLTMLWEGVVVPILDFLGYIQTPSIVDLPHVTWCTTGPLSFLPLHAAGNYNTGQAIFNYVVSSYTPTLSALLAPPPSAPFSGILTVGQEVTSDMPSLPGTVAELAIIQEKSRGHFVSRLDSKLATPAAVLAGMEKHSWVHLACHAKQNTTDPLQSAFYLHDGVLDLASITQKPLKHAELAFLSACQTATGDESISEEAVHLAAGMLMAGYRSVIATMWSIGDEDAPLVAERVYEYLMEGGKPDARRSAVAVHEATKRLRAKVGAKEFARWVPYIHIGL